MNPGKQRRLDRLCPSGDGRYLFIPMDHTFSDGPPELVGRFCAVAGAVAGAGADAVIVHKGRAARLAASSVLGGCGLIVHLSASTALGPDPDAKVLVGSVEDALCLGADAVSVHVNIGAVSEPEQLQAVGALATRCAAYGLPLLVMIYVRGPQVIDPFDPVALAHAANIAADLGADIVKTAMPRPIDEMASIVAACSERVIFSGGAAEDGQNVLGLARSAVAAGAAGLAVGRRVWTDRDPGGVVRELAAVVHPHRPATEPVLPALTEGVR